MTKTKCPDCGDVFSKIGSHWMWEPEHRPNISQKYMEKIEGLVMGDGCVRNRDSNKPRITVVNFTNKRYLEYVKSDVEWLWGDITKTRENTYRMSSRAHPEFQEMANWYKKSRKIWPEELNITPNVMKHLYVTDGNLDINRKSPVVRISALNQSGYEENFIKAVSRTTLPEPNYSEPNFYWSVYETDEFFEYIGEPLPGFEYKWPEEYRQS